MARRIESALHRRAPRGTAPALSRLAWRRPRHKKTRALREPSRFTTFADVAASEFARARLSRLARDPPSRYDERVATGGGRVGPPRPPRRRHLVTRAVGAEDGWGNPSTGPASPDVGGGDFSHGEAHLERRASASATRHCASALATRVAKASTWGRRLWRRRARSRRREHAQGTSQLTELASSGAEQRAQRLPAPESEARPGGCLRRAGSS